jgi:DNA-binding transcriptional MerR regulator
MIANQLRSQLSPLEEALACRRLRTEHGLTLKGIAQHLQLKQARVPRAPADPRAPRVAVAAHQQRRDPRRRRRSPRRDREDRARLAAEDRDYPTTTISHWILEWVPV